LRAKALVEQRCQGSKVDGGFGLVRSSHGKAKVLWKALSRVVKCCQGLS
jgi:hypothetical protein